MQTFLPYPDFKESARVLDRQRLGKQRVEVIQLLKALAGETKGWKNHPTCRMWRGHEQSLIQYGIAVCMEWIKRGYRDSCMAKIAAFRDRWSELDSRGQPSWIGREDVHSSHRAVLLGKDREWYWKFGWTEMPAVPDVKGSYKDTYVWPEADRLTA